MKVVIADTSPINYLVLIDAIEVLPQLYGRVIVPDEVFRELTDPGTPAIVARWMRGKPEWLKVRSVSAAQDPSLSELDSGEEAAILLAQEKLMYFSSWTTPTGDQRQRSEAFGLSEHLASFALRHWRI